MRLITDYGARTANTPTDNRAAIQAAIDEAFAAGGGTVLVPPGRFVSANLQLKSNVTLRLERGAILAGSQDWRDYQHTNTLQPWVSMSGIPGMGEEIKYAGFLWAEHAVNVGVEGPGVVDGQGAGHAFFPHPDDPMATRPMLIILIDCKDVRITDITMRNPAMFSFLGVRCRRVWIRGVSVYSWDTENGDGLDFDGSEDVMISDCHLESGDDAISLKCTVPGYPCRNYTITNCCLTSVWAGFRMGTESTADMRDIVLSNCVFRRCNDGLKIQDCAEGLYENVRVSNCVMRDVHRPVFMTVNSYRLSQLDSSIRPKLGGIRNVVLEGITAYVSAGVDYQRNSFLISGTAKSPIRDVKLRDFQVFFPGGGTEADAARTDVPEYLDYTFLYADVFSLNGNFPAAGPYLRHIDGLRIADCDFRLEAADMRPMFFAEDVRNTSLTDVRLRGDCACAVLAADSEISQSNCVHNDGPFLLKALEGAPLQRCQDAARDTRVTDALFDTWAEAVDRAERMELVTLLAPEAWEKDGAIWRTKFTAPNARMLWLCLYGDCEVSLNGAQVGECRICRLYRNLVKWSCDISKELVQGENLLEIRWDDPDDRGGSDSLLPFGEFRPFHVGLTQPARIYGE